MGREDLRTPFLEDRGSIDGEALSVSHSVSVHLRDQQEEG